MKKIIFIKIDLGWRLFNDKDVNPVQELEVLQSQGEQAL